MAWPTANNVKPGISIVLGGDRGKEEEDDAVQEVKIMCVLSAYDTVITDMAWIRSSVPE